MSWHGVNSGGDPVFSMVVIYGYSDSGSRVKARDDNACGEMRGEERVEDRCEARVKDKKIEIRAIDLEA